MKYFKLQTLVENKNQYGFSNFILYNIQVLNLKMKFNLMTVEINYQNIFLVKKCHNNYNNYNNYLINCIL